MLGIIPGIFTIGLGAKVFTPTGLPLSKTKNLTGGSAKAIGVVCISVGNLLHRKRAGRDDAHPLARRRSYSLSLSDHPM